MIQVKSFVFNPFMENTYVVYDETKEAIVVDPGCYEPYEKQQLSAWITEEDLKIVRLINTHGHIDHVLGNDYIKDKYKVALAIHALDEPVLKAVKAYAPNYGFAHYKEAEIDEYLKEGESVVFGNSQLDVIFVPGHAPGHIAMVSHSENICLSGDVLFDGSIGRTDLPGGDYDTLIQSIKEKMFPLGDEMTVYPGHGGITTIGKEKSTNPFVGVSA